MMDCSWFVECTAETTPSVRPVTDDLAIHEMTYSVDRKTCHKGCDGEVLLFDNASMSSKLYFNHFALQNRTQRS